MTERGEKDYDGVRFFCGRQDDFACTNDDGTDKREERRSRLQVDMLLMLL